MSNEEQMFQNPLGDNEVKRSNNMSNERKRNYDEKLILDGEVYRPLYYTESSTKKQIMVLLDRTEEDKIRLFLKGAHKELVYLQAHLEKASDEKRKENIRAYMIVVRHLYNRGCDDLETLRSKRNQWEYDEVLGEIEKGELSICEELKVLPETMGKLEEVKKQLLKEATEGLLADGQTSLIPYWVDVRLRWRRRHPDEVERLKKEKTATVDERRDNNPEERST